MSIPYSDLPFLVKDWIAAHPYQACLHVVNGVVLFTPAAVTVPALSLLGFTPAGPAGASAASATMSYFSFVPSGGIYATLQSAAMGGYGASIAAGAAQAGAVATSALGYLWGKTT